MIIDEPLLAYSINRNICFSLKALPQVTMQGKLVGVEYPEDRSPCMVLLTSGTTWKASWDICSMVWLNEDLETVS